MGDGDAYMLKRGDANLHTGEICVSGLSDLKNFLCGYLFGEEKRGVCVKTQTNQASLSNKGLLPSEISHSI